VARIAQLEREAQQAQAAASDALGKMANIDQREAELIAREAEFHRTEASLRRELEEARKPEVDELAERRLKTRDDELTMREAALNKAEQAILASRSRSEGKEKGLDEREHVLAGRAKELEEREAALNLREAQLEAEFEVREQRLEQREKAGAELEAQLSSRESDLSIYVAQLQENFDRREAEWWSKQLGGNAQQPPAA
jgi:multidrug efflux pump subunit AcrA (membrane-fusion protein)